jgi:hypothetical protein
VLAVVVTLGYLARQIHQQNKIAQHTAWQSIFDGCYQDFLDAIAKPEKRSINFGMGR